MTQDSTKVDSIHSGSTNRPPILCTPTEKGVAGLPPYIYDCPSKCVDFARLACVDGYAVIEGQKKRPWQDVQSAVTHEGAVFNITGNTLAIFTGHTNINHAFHDDLWSSIAWIEDGYPGSSGTDSMKVIFLSTNPWALNFLRVCNQAFNWSEVQAQNATKTCSTGNMYLNGFLRNTKKAP